MQCEFPRWRALVPDLLPVLPLVLCIVFREIWAVVVFFLSIALSIWLGFLWCSCPGCGANMNVRGGLNPCASGPYVCRHCGADIRLI